MGTFFQTLQNGLYGYELRNRQKPKLPITVP